MSDTARHDAHLKAFGITESYMDLWASTNPVASVLVAEIDRIVSAENDLLSLGEELTRAIARVAETLAGEPTHLSRNGVLQQRAVDYDRACALRAAAIESVRGIARAFTRIAAAN